MTLDHDANSMRFDDPRLTALALGELPGEDATALQQRIADDPALRSEFEAIRSTAALLREGFAAEPAEALTATQRESVLREPVAHRTAAARWSDQDRALNSPHVFTLRSRWIGSTLAAAAVIALSVTAAIMFNPGVNIGDGFARTQRDQSAARSTPPTNKELAPGGILNERDRSELQAGAAHSMRELNQAAANPPLPPSASPSSADSLSLAMPSESGESLVLKDAGEARSGVARSRSEPKSKAEVDAQSRLAAVDPARPQPVDASAGAPDERSKSGFVPTPSPRPSGPDASGGGGANAGAKAAEPSKQSRRAGQNSPASPSGADKKPASGAAVDDGTRTRDFDAPAAPASATAATSPGGAVAAESPEPDQQDPAVGRTGDLRPSMRGTQSSAPAEPEIQLYRENEIAEMPEGQVRDAVTRTDADRAVTRNGRTLALLKKQSEQLMSRLRAIKQLQAEEYSRINDNPFIRPVGESALSTFSIDVDTASYANVRRFLNAGELPPPDAVRIEELINYFRYDYAPPSAADGDSPIKANVEVAAAPWNPAHRLVRIGLRGKEERLDMRLPTSLVFLIDVSGSMNSPDKLPLVKQSLGLLIQQLNADDRLAIVTYAGNAGVALESCYVNAENRETVETAISTLTPGGGTNGAGGINLAYDIARKNFIKGGNNRVILCTDGDFNVGVSGDDALVNLIEQQRESGVFLTVLGFGTGNLKDSKMQKLADKGNGNFAYIDSIDEARKVLVEQMGSTLITIAKDVKLQVEFNPAKVGAYRLIGYEDRLLEARDFNNDLKDAGEVGSGHTVTALYEVVPVGQEADALALNAADGEASELKYQKPAAKAGGAGGDASGGAEPGSLVSDELCEVRIRHKLPDADESTLSRFAVKDAGKTVGDASDDFRFAAAVAEFGMLLRYSPYKAGATFDHAYILAESALGDDEQGYRAQFLQLVRKAQKLTAD